MGVLTASRPVIAETPLARGAYLAEGIADCGKSHVPQEPLGRGPAAIAVGRSRQADPAMTIYPPNITPDRESGIGTALTLSGLFTFFDFQLVYAITRGGPFNSTHLIATLAFQRAIPGSQLGEGAAIAVSMIPFLLVASLVCFFGVGRRKWHQGTDNN
jgi:hypothetical protein